MTKPARLTACLTLFAAGCAAELPDEGSSSSPLLGIEEPGEPPEKEPPTEDDRGAKLPGLQIDPSKSTGFADLAGTPVWLTGIAVAGGDNGYPLYGWPW